MKRTEVGRGAIRFRQIAGEKVSVTGYAHGLVGGDWG